jgi:predicted transcriptional regulator
MMPTMGTPGAREILARHLRRPPGDRAAGAAGAVLMSIKPVYARLIERGVKRVEFRRRFPIGIERGRVVFYVSSPVRAVTMVVGIERVVRGTPAELWEEFGEEAGASRGEFDEYFAGAHLGVALVLGEVRVLGRAIGLGDARLRAVGFRPPQSLVVLAGDSPVMDLLGM